MTRSGWKAASMIFLAAGFAVAAAQQSAVEGCWQGTSDTANGEVTLTYNFNVKGQVLTGTEESPMFSHPISEGKVNGNKISFKTTVNGNSIEHEGTVSGDTIQFKNFGPGGEFDVTVKRQSSENKSAER